MGTIRETSETSLTRHLPAVVPILVTLMPYPARMGAYTALWAAFSKDVTVEDGGQYVVPPFGRLHASPRADLLAAMKKKEDGGTGLASGFMEY